MWNQPLTVKTVPMLVTPVLRQLPRLSGTAFAIMFTRPVPTTPLVETICVMSPFGPAVGVASRWLAVASFDLVAAAALGVIVSAMCQTAV